MDECSHCHDKQCFSNSREALSPGSGKHENCSRRHTMMHMYDDVVSVMFENSTKCKLFRRKSVKHHAGCPCPCCLTPSHVRHFARNLLRKPPCGGAKNAKVPKTPESYTEAYQKKQSSTQFDLKSYRKSKGLISNPYKSLINSL